MNLYFLGIVPHTLRSNWKHPVHAEKHVIWLCDLSGPHIAWKRQCVEMSWTKNLVDFHIQLQMEKNAEYRVLCCIMWMLVCAALYPLAWHVMFKWYILTQQQGQVISMPTCVNNIAFINKLVFPLVFRSSPVSIFIVLCFCGSDITVLSSDRKEINVAQAID